MAAQRGSLFGCSQLEFGFLLGTTDGRYLVRSPGEDTVEAVLVLGTLGAPERRWLRDRRPRTIEQAAPEPVPTARATVVRPEPFADENEARAWLDELRGDPELRDAELAAAAKVLNRALSAQRLAAADPYLADVSVERALAARIGYGSGNRVADGEFAQALELPSPGGRRTKRSMAAPEERFAAILGGRETTLTAEELVLRARADLDAGRRREAALQARVAIEALLAETEERSLDPHRPLVVSAAAAALDGEPAEDLEEAVRAMEMVLRRRHLSGRD